MDALALALLWMAVVVPVGVSAARRRRDSIADFERALSSLRPADVRAAHAALDAVDRDPSRRAEASRLIRRRRVAVALTALVAVALLAAALERTRATVGAGALVANLCIAYAAAVVAADRGQLRPLVK